MSRSLGHYAGLLALGCNIAQGFCLCNVVRRWVLKQHWTWFFPVKYCLEPLRQHCTENLPVQCYPKSVKRTLNRFFSCAILSGASSWTTLHKVFTYFPNVVPRVLRQHHTWFFPVECCLEPLGQHYTRILPAKCWPTRVRQHSTGFSPVQCLEPLGQYCTRILPVQCCPKRIKTTLNRFFSCAMLSGASWTTLYKDFTCAMLSHTKY